MAATAEKKGHDETALARRAREGDRKAFAHVVRLYQSPVYRLCWRYLRSPEAEDMAQETFLRAFVHRVRFDPNKPLLPWLLTIARRVCIDRLRRKKPLLDDEVAQRATDPAPNAEQTAATREQIGLLGKALAELPEGQREVVALFHLEHMGYEDISQALDIPMGTVMTWLHRGRARLRERVAQAQQDPARSRNAAMGVLA